MNKCATPPVMGLLVLVIGSVLFPTPAMAQYLDPGVGSVLVQVLVAAAVGTSALVRFNWARIRSFLARRSGRNTEQ